MIRLIHSIIFLVGFVWMIVERVKFEKKHKGEESEYVSLYREHNTLQIILFAALTFYCASRYFGID